MQPFEWASNLLVDTKQLQTWYFAGVIVILVHGLFPLGACSELFYSSYPRLPSVLKAHATVLLVWDWYLVVNYLARDIYNASLGYVAEGLWCNAHGFTNIAGVLTLRISAAVTAYAVYRLSKNNPLSDKVLYYSHAFALICGLAFASLFIFSDSYGPYKDLYCCVQESGYKAYATIPCYIITFSSIFAVVYFNTQAQRELAKKESEISHENQVIIKRGLRHQLSFYVLWSGIIGAGLATALGVHVPMIVDLLAAWVVKLEATVDSYLLSETINMVMNYKPGKQGSWPLASTKLD